MKGHTAVVWALSVWAIIIASPAWAGGTPMYSTSLIHPPVGHTGAFVQRLNDVGQVAGISGVGDDFSDFTPFVWSGDGAHQSPATGSWVLGLNNAGALLTNTGLWSAAGEPIPLGSIDDAHLVGSGGALDDHGRVFTSFGDQAFIWSPGTGVTTVNGTGSTRIVAANNNLQAIGERVLITPAGVSPLTTPSFAYSDHDFLTYDISDTGMIVGEAWGVDGLHGVAWLPDGSVIDLGIGNMPAAVNDLGEVAGFTWDHRYFLWSAEDGFTWIDADNGVPGIGFPIDYNNRGEILFSRGATEPAWLLTPIPAPMTGLILAPLLAARRRR